MPMQEDQWKNRTEKVVSPRERSLQFYRFTAHGRNPMPRPQNAELFSLTYGALVVQLIKDYEDYGEVNKQLDKM